MKLPSATFFGWSCVSLQVSEKNWKWQHFVPAQLEISQHKVGDAEGSFTALKRQLQVKMRAERQSRKRFHLWPTQFWPLFRKTLKHTFPAPCYVPLELKHVLKCHLVQTHQRNRLSSHHPPPSCLVPISTAAGTEFNSTRWQLPAPEDHRIRQPKKCVSHSFA